MKIKLLILFFFNVIAFAKIINVPTDYSSIQKALNAAEENDTILVAPGTYFENIVWPDVNGVKLFSTGNWDNTIIDGNYISRVISIFNSSSNLIDSTTIIRGFTITHGKSENGGGIFCGGASPKLIALRIKENESTGSDLGDCMFKSKKGHPRCKIIIINL